MNIYTPADLREYVTKGIFERHSEIIEKIMAYLAQVAKCGQCQAFYYMTIQERECKEEISTYFSCKGFLVTVGETGILINFE